MPEPQVSLFDSRGRFVGRVDGWLEREALALQPDGRAKYFLDEQPLSADIDRASDDLLELARRRMIKEKERRDRIVDLGAEVMPDASRAGRHTCLRLRGSSPLDAASVDAAWLETHGFTQLRPVLGQELRLQELRSPSGLK